MIFCFLSESEKISCLVLKIIRELDKAAKPVDIASLPYADAESLLYLLHLPPHLLTLESMVFCHTAVQRLCAAYPSLAGHHVSISLARDISIEDGDGCRVYYVPSSAKGHRTLQF